MNKRTLQIGNDKRYENQSNAGGLYCHLMRKIYEFPNMLDFWR
jgi:hypothetical protein